MKNSTRVIFNSFVLYGRLVITTVIKLMITKLLVKYLGLEGFGLYNLLSGIVVMLAFFKATLASTSQRFLSVSMGKGELGSTQEVYYNLYVLHTAMSLLILLIVDVFGILLVHYVLNIPAGQERVAVMLIQTMAVSTAITILSVPNDALLIAKENLLALSLIVILESILNLVAVYSLNWIAPNDRLSMYALMVVGYIFITFVVRHIYVRRYQETHVRIHKLNDFGIIKEIGNYTGWSTISSLFYLIRNQGYAILFNVVGGVMVNSAYGVANQVNGLITYATEALMQPLRPQIMKTESSGNREKSASMMVFASKAMVALLIAIITPILIFIDQILCLWIEDVPKLAPDFCRILLVSAFLFAFSNSIKALLEAVGDVKKLFSVIGYLHIGALVISTLLVICGASITIAFSMVAVEEVCASSYRIYLAKKIMNYDIIGYCKDFVIKGFASFFICVLLMYLFVSIVDSIFVQIIMVAILLVATLLVYYAITFTYMEKGIIKKIICHKYL